MGVDPRAKVACSHFPDSIRTKGHSDNAQTGDDQARGILGNVFN